MAHQRKILNSPLQLKTEGNLFYKVAFFIWSTDEVGNSASKIKGKVKVKVTLEQATNAQRRSRDTTVLFL
jgi:hypothetical protein